MSDKFPPASQRQPLLDLIKALGCRDNALRRDECGDWRINGKRGHIYAIPGTIDRVTTRGFQIFVMGWTARGWNSAKGALSFAALTNDGDDEGALFLDRLPNADEAELLRHYLAIPKKRELDEATLARLREHMASEGFRAKKPASEDLDGGEPPDGSPEGNSAFQIPAGFRHD